MRLRQAELILILGTGTFAGALLSILWSNRLHFRVFTQISSRARGYNADDYSA
jgi:hypothetical protein